MEPGLRTFVYVDCAYFTKAKNIITRGRPYYDMQPPEDI